MQTRTIKRIYRDDVANIIRAAKLITQWRKANYDDYERLKARIVKLNLSTADYETAVSRLAAALEV